MTLLWVEGAEGWKRAGLPIDADYVGYSFIDVVLGRLVSYNICLS